jgi:1-deoxy-D-xylulose-5-phosphate reductoisomerase
LNQWEIHIGTQALLWMAEDAAVDMVMAAIVGAAGLLPTLAAAKAGKKILLANKEALVMTGELLLDTAREAGAEILPVDSEHNAIFQCLPDVALGKPLLDYGVRRIILTASGGPFRTFTSEQMKTVTPEQACAHPNWDMGKKISVDSASMMNKGLEVIEAKWLFNAPIEMIDVILQPQSIIHSMVEYTDGSVLAELGVPDMRTPISNVLGFPKRLQTNVNSLNFNELTSLEFQPVDYQQFPCLELAYQALKTGGTACAIMNAANEIAVEAFLNRQIKFTRIADVIQQSLDTLNIQTASSFDVILEADTLARRTAKLIIKS